MAPQSPTAASDGVEEADLAKAFQELAKGERTATALENQLNAMEARIEALLREAERAQQETQRVAAGSHGSNGNDPRTSTGESDSKT